MNNFSIGTKLQELRRKKGLTQKEVGNILGMSNRQISYYENECTDETFKQDTLNVFNSFYEANLLNDSSKDAHKMFLTYNLDNLEELAEVKTKIENIKMGLINNTNEFELIVNINIKEFISIGDRE